MYPSGNLSGCQLCWVKETDTRCCFDRASMGQAEIRSGPPRETNRSTRLRDRHTVGSGEGGSDLNIPILQERPLLGSVLVPSSQALGCSLGLQNCGERRESASTVARPGSCTLRPPPPRQSMKCFNIGILQFFLDYRNNTYS